jgi:alanyl-tRNA synthetase
MSVYKDFDEPKKFACRVIADHARATAFSIADGILPGNEGRNYVLRKIMRRAIYQGRHALGLEDLFFYKVTNFVVDQMGEAFPELESHRDFIEKMVKLEEERFGSTLMVGLNKLDALLDEMNPEGGFIPAVKLAQLTVPMYDTYGLPRDLIRVALVERGHSFAQDEDTFNEMFDDALRQLQQAGENSQRGGTEKARPVYRVLANKGSNTRFTGYDETQTEGSIVLALLKGDQSVSELNEGDEGEIVLNRTPFYAEAGGQVGDKGEMTTLNGAHITVTDTVSPVAGLIVHRVKVDRGLIRTDPYWDTMSEQEKGRILAEYSYPEVVTAKVDVEKRDATRRNHTATHLMHAALREVLGTHVKQAGSVVAPNYLRFDFSHYQPLTDAEVEEIERLVNYHILRNEPVQTDEMAVEEAMRSGAMALFGEKYGEKVRVLSIKGAEGIFSKELCGGTHVRATGDIGVFKITSDESIASGVRRIRAVTGVDAYERFREDEEIISQVTTNLRTSRAELPTMIGKLQDELKKARREAEELKLKIATGAVGSAASNGDDAREVAGVRVLAREASGLDSAGMRQLSDTLLARIKSGVVVIGRSSDGKASLIVRTSDDLTKKVPAGLVIKELAPIIGGKGGGKADMAEGGGNQPEKLAEALEASYGVIERMLSA